MLFNLHFVCTIITLINLNNFKYPPKSVCVHRLIKITSGQTLARSNIGSPRFTDFPSLYACSESSLTNLIGSGLNLLFLQSHSKPKCRWTWQEVAILGDDQKERGLWGRECYIPISTVSVGSCSCLITMPTNAGFQTGSLLSL